MNERLEEIKKQWESGVVKEKHFNWLLEQAERVEELEENKHWLIKDVLLWFDKFNDEKQQNKRYRGVIDEIREYITDCEKVDTEVVSYVIGDIIDEALEETE